MCGIYVTLISTWWRRRAFEIGINCPNSRALLLLFLLLLGLRALQAPPPIEKFIPISRSVVVAAGYLDTSRRMGARARKTTTIQPLRDRRREDIVIHYFFLFSKCISISSHLSLCLARIGNGTYKSNITLIEVRYLHYNSQQVFCVARSSRSS